MTAKEAAKKSLFEFLEKEYPDVDFIDHYDVPEWMIEAMQSYTLHIAEKAVEDLRDYSNGTGLNYISNAGARELLSRINQQRGGAK